MPSSAWRRWAELRPWCSQEESQPPPLRFVERHPTQTPGWSRHSRVPLALAPPYRASNEAASYTPGSPRHLLLTKPTPPAPLPPCDALSLAARRRPLASHRLLPPARRCRRAIEEPPRDASAAVHSPPLPRVSPHMRIPFYATDARSPSPARPQIQNNVSEGSRRGSLRAGPSSCERCE